MVVFMSESNHSGTATVLTNVLNTANTEELVETKDLAAGGYDEDRD